MLGLGASPPRRDDVRLKLQPLTKRGRQTRAALIQGARHIFERDGYLDARLSDITAQAGCSIGTFYTYFKGKEEIMAVVLLELEDEMFRASRSRHEVGEVDPVDLIRTNNRTYLETYARNAMLMRCMEQVAIVDAEFQRLRLARAHRFIARNAKLIRQLQGQGLADPGLDPDLGARALSSMVSRLAFTTFVLGDDVPLDDLVEVATRLWVNGLGLAEGTPDCNAPVLPQ